MEGQLVLLAGTISPGNSVMRSALGVLYPYPHLARPSHRWEFRTFVEISSHRAPLSISRAIHPAWPCSRSPA